MPIVEQIYAIVGDRGLLTGADVAARSCDPFSHIAPGSPALVRPDNAQDLADVMALCHAAGQRIVTHGGCTGVAGGAIAGADEIVISLERMARIIEIDPVGLTATVEAGATLEAVQNAAAAQGLLYPIDLGAKGSATIGGTIATNAGGNRVIRWGMTRQNVLGLEAVLADGTRVDAMNRFLKNNTGYDLKQLFIGSEGTLGVVTRAVLKLVTAPTTQMAAVLAVPDYPAVLELLTRARRMQALSAFEVMWQNYYAMIAQHDPGRCPVAADQPFTILVEAMGNDETADTAAFEAFLEHALAAGLIHDAAVAHSTRQIAALWRVRESSDILMAQMGPFVSFDISVDIRRTDAFVAATFAALTERFGPHKAVSFGHLGDSNIHIGVHLGPNTPARELDIETTVYAVTRQFGGALTAEHGVGTQKRQFLPDHVTPAALATMRRVRDALDGDRLLNHNVMF